MNDCPDIHELDSAHWLERNASHLAECSACRDLSVLAASKDAPCELTNDCTAVEPLIAVMVVRSLDADDRARVDAHLAGCPRCLATAAEVLLVGEPVAAGAVDAPLQHSITLGRVWSRRAVPLLASAVVAAAAAIALMLALRSSSEDRSPRPVDRAAADRRSDQTHSVPRKVPAPRPIALVVLLQGQGRWMGNETYLEDDDPDRMIGAYVGVGAALDALSAMGPPGSRGALITYASKTSLRYGMTDLRQMGASALGRQNEYGDLIGRAFLAGLREAHLLLAFEETSRKVLVVIGDGEGQKEDISTELARVIETLENDGVETYTLQHHAAPTDNPVGMRNMSELGYNGSYTATSRDEFGILAKMVVESVMKNEPRPAVLETAGDPHGAVPAAAVPGEITALQKASNGQTIITINRGTDHGVAKGWIGAVTDGPGGAELPNGRLTILKVSSDESFARIELPFEVAKANRNVDLWP